DWSLAVNYPGFSGPEGVAIDSQGDVWVANTGADSLSRIGGSEIAHYDNIKAQGANFSSPFQLAIDSSDRVWISNLNGNTVTAVLRHPDDSLTVGNFDADGGLHSPGGVAIGQNNHVWVTDQTDETVTGITELDPTGAPLNNFDNQNANGASFNGVLPIAIDLAGQVWAGNQGNASVTRLSFSPPPGTVSNCNNNNLVPPPPATQPENATLSFPTDL